ncbi:50S ribosomal protein L28 [candidate division WWE3 bacterium]|nr:50S ribosomal protein L28 [candidate division WWE3 bacterium]
MSRICELCSKTYQRGNLVPRGIGRRVTRRTLTRQQPNIRTVRFDVEDGNKITLKICTSCLKRLRKDEREQGLNAVKDSVAEVVKVEKAPVAKTSSISSKSSRVAKKA